jgi:wyosine [tRNA(Phe)-imidazoG37] synthetase (radical SAM superfamily)
MPTDPLPSNPPAPSATSDLSAPAVAPTPLRQLYSHHPRRWQQFLYVYPVFSRRSHGLSIGINLNPDKVCNWDCVYCQVDRATAPIVSHVDLPTLAAELDTLLRHAATGDIWLDEPFTTVPPPLRRINDIAFSGDGEPTTYPHFDQAIQLAADLKSQHHLPDVKIIVLTNMTMLHRPQVQRGLALLDQHNSEIWAKLDAGSQSYYDQIDRSAVKLDRILDNILAAGQSRPIVIQSLFMQLHQQPIPTAEFDAYLDRLADLSSAGCRIKLVQLYTIARSTAESYATPLTPDQLNHLAHRLRLRLPHLPCETFL